jgi:hypothetical protein
MTKTNPKYNNKEYLKTQQIITFKKEIGKITFNYNKINKINKVNKVNIVNNNRIRFRIIIMLGRIAEG